MVAGATGIDMFLMTIAADDGVMPQTREHAAVLRALQVCNGVVAVTKADLADPELAMLEAGELFPGAEVVAVSARTGAGLDELREALGRVAAQTDSRAAQDARDATARRPRVHDQGRRDRRHRHAVVGLDRTAATMLGVAARAAASAGTRGPRPRRDRRARGGRPAGRGQPRRAVGRRRRRVAMWSWGSTVTCARPTCSTPSSSSDTRSRHRRPCPGPPRDPRGAGAADVAGWALLAGPARAATDRGRRRPDRDPPDRAARHDRRGTGARSASAQARTQQEPRQPD